MTEMTPEKYMRLQDELIKRQAEIIEHEKSRADDAEERIARLIKRLERERARNSGEAPEEDADREQRRKEKKTAHAAPAADADAKPRTRGKCRSCSMQITGFLCETEACVAARKEKRAAREAEKKALMASAAAEPVDDPFQ